MRALLLFTLLFSVPVFAKIGEKQKFPSFKLPILNSSRGVASTGSTFDSASLKGKVVLVDFWASWCEPCKASLPKLEMLSKKLKNKGVVVIGVNVNDKAEEGTNFLKEHKMNLSFPLVFDNKKELIGQVEVPAMPSSYILDKTGTVVKVHKGYRPGDEAQVEKFLMTLASAK